MSSPIAMDPGGVAIFARGMIADVVHVRFALESKDLALCGFVGIERKCFGECGEDGSWAFHVKGEKSVTADIFIVDHIVFWPKVILICLSDDPRLIPSFFVSRDGLVLVCCKVIPNLRECAQRNAHHARGYIPFALLIFSHDELPWFVGEEVIDVVKNKHIKINKEEITFETVKVFFEKSNLLPPSPKRGFVFGDGEHFDVRV